MGIKGDQEMTNQPVLASYLPLPTHRRRLDQGLEGRDVDDHEYHDRNKDKKDQEHQLADETGEIAG